MLVVGGVPACIEVEGASHHARPPTGSLFLRTTIPLAVALALCNMDRIVLSVAMLPIAREFGFDIAAQVSGCHDLCSGALHSDKCSFQK